MTSLQLAVGVTVAALALVGVLIALELERILGALGRVVGWFHR